MIVLPFPAPLAQAILDVPAAKLAETYVVLKDTSGNTYYRAAVKSWCINKDTKATVAVELEEWEDIMERRAKLAGL